MDEDENENGPGIDPSEIEGMDVRKIKVRKVARIFRPQRLLVSGETSLNRLVKLLLEHKENNNIYVVDDEGRLRGIITFHELLKVIWAKFGLMDKEIFDHMEFVHYAYSTTAEDIMAPAVSVTDSDSLYTAIRLMEEHHLRDIPLVDGDGQVIEEVNSTELLAFGRKILKHRLDKTGE